MREMTKPAQHAGQVAGDDRVHGAEVGETGETKDAGASATEPVVMEQREAGVTGALGAAAHGHSAHEHPTGQQPTVLMVDELAGPEDYWLTLTDAARITRRQEVTIRRWVAAGHLPVRRQPMGLTKRTRHIRASDLAQLTPIIDPSAAISDATAHLDLVGIPLQQSQLLAAQHRLTQDLVRLLQRVSELAAEAHVLTGQVQILTERQHATDEGIARVIAHTAATDKEVTEQLALVNTGLDAVQAHSARLADEGQALAARVLQVTGTVEVLHQRLAAAGHVLDDIAREMEAAKTAITTQQTKLTSLQEHVTRHEMANAAQVERITPLEANLIHLLEQHQIHVQQLQHTAARADHSAQVQEQHTVSLAALAARMAALEQAGEREAAGRRIRSRRRAAATRMRHLER